MAIFKPEITWKGAVPESNQSSDIYYSVENGLEESIHVFLKGNNLPERLMNPENDTFVILETGFGTGLNFAALLNQLPENGPKIHYISIEKYPISKDEIKRALDVFGDLREIKNEIIEVYPPRLCSFHRVHLKKKNATLTLVFNDIAEALEKLVIPRGVDAFFLDGFNPSTNPEMWSEEILLKLSSLAGPGATLSTFTAAGHVRRNLEKAGFEVKKIPGYGKKREMISAVMKDLKKPDKSPYLYHFIKNPGKNKSVSIIGGGVAGIAAASSFLLRGFDVKILEKNNGFCREASGNPLGIFFPVVHRRPTFADRFSLSAYNYFLNLTSNYNDSFSDIDFYQPGLLQVLGKDDRVSRFNDYASLHGSIERPFEDTIPKEIIARENKGYVFFPRGGYLNPESFFSRILKDQSKNSKGSLEVLFDFEGVEIYKNKENWVIKDKNGKEVKSQNLVLANSYSILDFYQASQIPLRKIRGQLIITKDKIEGMDFPVSSDIYTISSKYGTLLGATHDFDENKEPDISQANELLESAKKVNPDSPSWNTFFSKNENSRIEKLEKEKTFKDDFKGWAARVSFRSAAVDHFPVIGAVPDFSKYPEVFSDLSNGPLNYFRKNGYDYKPTAWNEGLYCISGLGSRGIIYSLLGAEIVASMVSQEPLPVERDIIEALSPARFLYRKIRKK